jgi:hypothetical protein
MAWAQKAAPMSVANAAIGPVKRFKIAPCGMNRLRMLDRQKAIWGIRIAARTEAGIQKLIRKRTIKK